MCMRSNNKIHFANLLITAVISILGAVVAIGCKDIGYFFVLVVPVMMMTFWYWIAFGREIQLTEEGCIVSFLCFRKLYRWDQMKTKQLIPIRIGQGWYGIGPTYNGLLLSSRKIWLLDIKVFLGHVYSIPTLHPFSLVFVMFEPRLNPPTPAPHWAPTWMKQELDSGYFADEEELFSLLNSWGVNLDDEKN